MKNLSIDKKHYEINGGGFGPNTDYRYINLSCFDKPDDEDLKDIQIPIPVTLDEKWFQKKQDYNKDLLDLKKDSDILHNLNKKLKSGFYLDKISIDADGVEAYKEKDYIRLIFMHGILLDDGKMVEDGGDYVSIYLPLPLRFDEEWFKKYKEINLNVETIKNCHLEGYLKSDLTE